MNYEELTDWQLGEGDQLTTVIGAETVLNDLYLEGWSPDDEGFEQVMLNACEKKETTFQVSTSA